MSVIAPRALSPPTPHGISGTQPAASTDRTLDEFPMDIGEAMISPARAEGQATMIHSHLMQYGGMEIMHSADLVH